MLDIRKLCATGAALMLAACASQPMKPTVSQVGIYSAGQGGVFLPYAQGLGSYLSAQGLKAQAVQSTGSIENLQKVDAEPLGLGTVFLGNGYEAVTGTGAWTQGKKLANVRALFPMYETSFQVVALRSAGLASVRQLAGKRVGVGPAGGPAEAFFKGLAEQMGLQVQTVAGTPAALSADLQSGKIDALWQGAALPIPAIAQVANATDAVVFGLQDDELAAMLGRFPYLSPATVAPNTYRGQTSALKSVAAWNFIVAHKDLPEADAYWITKTALEAPDYKMIHESAKSTKANNAPNNTVVPFHPGALKYYREQGVTGLR